MENRDFIRQNASNERLRHLREIKEISKLPKLSFSSASRSIAVVSTPRSGSNLFVSKLASTGKFGVKNDYWSAHSEYFGRFMLRAYATYFGLSEVSLPDYSNWIRTRLSGEDGTFVAKLHVYQIQYLNSLGYDILGEFDSLIFLYRKDKFAQAYSNAKAFKTREWTLVKGSSMPSELQEVDINLSAVMRDLAAINEQEEWFESDSRYASIPKFAYEDFANDPDILRKAAKELNLGLADSDVFQTNLLRQTSPRDEAKILKLKSQLVSILNYSPE